MPDHTRAHPILAMPDHTRAHPSLTGAGDKPPLFACERSWDVLPDKPTWTEFTYRSNVLVHESGSSCESFPLACDREGLTRRSSDNNVCCSHIRAPIDFRDISKIRDIRVMVLQDGGWEWVDFAECQRLPPQWLPCDGGGFYSAEDADVFHWRRSFSSCTSAMAAFM